MTIHLAEIVDVDVLERRIAEGHISRRRHPHADLFVLNYTKSAQYNRNVMCDPVVRECRGLIVDGDGFVVARPFPKFGNVGEYASSELTGAALAAELAAGKLPPLPVHEPFEVYEKVDGSLGVIYPVDGTWAVATRGSFESPQAQWATEWLRRHVLPTFTPTPGQTLLAEIIAPVSRVIVSYDFDGLVLLANIDNATGADRPLPTDWPARIVDRYPFDDFAAVAALAGTNPAGSRNREGYVIRFASGARAKIKWAEYLRLARAMTSLTERTVWEYAALEAIADSFGLTAENVHDPVNVSVVTRLSYVVHRPRPEIVATIAAGGSPMNVLLEQVPDEFFGFIRDTAAALRTRAATVEAEAYEVYAKLTVGNPSRKELAARAAQHPLRSYVFRILDGAPVTDLSWAAVRPEPHQVPALAA